MTPVEDPMHVALRVARAFERAGVDYAIGGSVASSAYGEPRATRDLDFAVRLTLARIPAVIDALGPDFVADREVLAAAVRTGMTANIFYLPFFTKVDLFVRGDEPYDRAEFARRTEIEPVPGQIVLASSAEDNLLWKLRWFRRGEEVSDQQWRDILGLVRVSGRRMDVAYLSEWAEYHGVRDLLERAMAQTER